MQRLKEFIEANPEAAADESMAAADESTAEEPAAADAEEATEDTPAAEQAAEDTNGDEVTYLRNYNLETSLLHLRSVSYLYISAD